MDILKMLAPPRAAIFVSEEAAEAIRRAMGGGDRICRVRVTDIRPMTTGRKKKFGRDDDLTFRLTCIRGAIMRRDEYRFCCDRVFVCANRKYARFLIGGRVLHYEKRSESVPMERGSFSGPCPSTFRI